MDHQECPLCYRSFAQNEIEQHVNKCIFLNSVGEQDNQKRKRPTSSKDPSNTEVEQSLPITSDLLSPLKKLKGTEPTMLKRQGAIKHNKMATTTNRDDQTADFSKSWNDNEASSEKIKKAMTFSIPLAKQVQPKLLNEFFGQNQVLGHNTVLRNLLEKGEIPNMILWGPPGCGKTSLANVIHEICKSDTKKFKYVALCAADSGVKEVQNIVSIAKGELKFGRRTILFMDEIHRFNKRQQDVFLAHVEKGDIVLIGATTENPSFAINNALLSRCRVIVLEKLETPDMVLLLERATSTLAVKIVPENVPKNGDIKGICIEKSAITWLADTSDGDARISLSNLQLVLQHNSDPNKLITVEDIKEGIKKSHMLYDRKGEEHYNLISAMHKSIRGSDENAALYWTTRMIVSGEDPLYIARRMVRAASEDIGNADPTALQLAVTTMQGCQLLGMPEADVLLAQCAIYLARAPKSREADSALAEAKKTIKQCQGPQPSVPLHIRNAPTKLMKDLGYGEGYSMGKEMTFMPPGLENADFF